MKRTRLNAIVFASILILFSNFHSHAEIAPVSSPRQCWHYNCWTYPGGWAGNIYIESKTECDWEVESCDGRAAEFPAV